MSMRLINTETYELTSFIGDEIPRYAILSHTWEEDELSFQEFQAINRRRGGHSVFAAKAGYRKVLNFCRKARREGFTYAWVDTCCIDKTSSAELSEAINSMFSWYKTAAVCYVLLSDFQSGKHVPSQNFRDCRWFTRGWCLQELLAPKQLRFFDRSWHHVGWKQELVETISNITRIDSDVLKWPSCLEGVPIARRMSWAADRKTTRKEDEAYCLLGLFDINMPLLYGEGWKAFGRLQEEIIRQSSDLSIFASGIITPAAKGSVAYHSGSSCGLLASSTQDFMFCSSLQAHRRSPIRAQAFSVSNNGIYFRELRLEVDLAFGLYRFPLHCSMNGVQDVHISLRQLGPGLYGELTKYDLAHLKRCGNDNFTIALRDVYILTTPAQKLRLRFGVGAISIQCTTHCLGRAIRPVLGSFTSANWNYAKMSFMASSDPLECGHWVIYPSLARSFRPNDTVSSLPPGCFYLVAGFRESSEGDRQAWLCLYSSDEWRELTDSYGDMTDREDTIKHQMNASMSCEIKLAEVTITASASGPAKEDDDNFNIHIDFAL